MKLSEIKQAIQALEVAVSLTTEDGLKHLYITEEMKNTLEV